MECIAYPLKPPLLESQETEGKWAFVALFWDTFYTLIFVLSCLLVRCIDLKV